MLERIIHPDDRERVQKEIASADEAGTPFQTEYRVLARGGSVVWLREHARTISKRDGRPVFGESFLLDIGERKRIEDECDGLVAAERTAVAETAAPGRFEALRLPIYRILWVSSTLMHFAIQAQQVARGWLAVELTGGC